MSEKPKTKIVIMDTAISLAPEEWLKNKKIKQYHQKHNRMPLVDASIHQHLLRDIPRDERLDRPDILHFGLLTLLGYQSIMRDNFDFEIYFGIKGDNSCSYYHVKSDTRLPRSQIRFYGIMEGVLSGDDNNYITVNKNFERSFANAEKIAYTHDASIYPPLQGEVGSVSEYYVFGGFSTGGYRSDLGERTEFYSLHSEGMELWTALSLFLGTCL